MVAYVFAVNFLSRHGLKYNYWCYIFICVTVIVQNWSLKGTNKSSFGNKQVLQFHISRFVLLSSQDVISNGMFGCLETDGMEHKVNFSLPYISHLFFFPNHCFPLRLLPSNIGLLQHDAVTFGWQLGKNVVSELTMLCQIVKLM